MHSEFTGITLDQLRYSLVWEDSETLYASLDVQPEDRVLVITSAGCNVLNALLRSPAEVIAIDLNPEQNRLLLFKKYIILHHEYAIFRALMGFDGSEAVAPAFHKVVITLPPDDADYWTTFFKNNPDGILTAGKLETYVTHFLPTLPATIRQKLYQLVIFDTVAEQYDFFMSTLNVDEFREPFISYFDEQNLSKGRDPSLFRYAEESGGLLFYNRLCEQVSRVLVRDNFFFRFFFFGPQYLPNIILPPAYRPENYAQLRANLDRLAVVTGEAVGYLVSDAGQSVSKASLSNIFEYVSQVEFRRVCQSLVARPGHRLRFMFWNLLQAQGAWLAEDGWQDVLNVAGQVPNGTACFYFQNVRVVEPSPT